MGGFDPQNGSGGGGAERLAPDAARPNGPLRVIVVGRTGLDAQLRTDPDIELVRARSRLDAIGELAEPADAPSVVIVGNEASSENAAPAAAAFAEALRRVDPAVRIIAAAADTAAELGGAGEGSGSYDAVVRPDAAAETLRRAIHGAGLADVGRPAQPPTVREGVPAPQIAAPSDADILDAYLHARDPVPLLLASLRERLGREAELLAPDRPAPDAARIALAGRTLGHLRSPGLTPDQLAPSAAWLGPWLALRDQHAQLRDAAFTDPLTGAYNRRFFERFLSAAIDRARRARQSVTVLLFDLDGFKTFNDRFGHGAGDEILRETVRLLRSVIRPTDKVCRIGGDEFAVIFHDPEGPRTATSRPPSDVFQIAGRFQQAVRDARFPKLGAEAPGSLTISGGLATFPWDGHSPEALLARADELAMQSKREGKNAIRFGPGSDRVS